MCKAIEKLKDLSRQRLKESYPSVPEKAIPNPKYSDGTTNQLTKCIIDWLVLNGWQAERINSTGRPVDTTETIIDSIGRARHIGSVSWIKGSSTKGTADISAVILGRAVKIEVKNKKTGDNYQSEDQKKYQAEVERAGGVYVIARTFEGFSEWYHEFINKISQKS